MTYKMNLFMITINTACTGMYRQYGLYVHQNNVLSKLQFNKNMQARSRVGLQANYIGPIWLLNSGQKYIFFENRTL